MTNPRTKLLEQLEAQARDGRRFTILESQQTYAAGTKDNPGATMGGLKDLRTSEGKYVEHNANGTYTIFRVDFDSNW